MDDDVCNHLQTLWEKLKIFGFNLTWLEPHVQSALSIKICVKRALVVKRLEENVAILEMEAMTSKIKND